METKPKTRKAVTRKATTTRAKKITKKVKPTFDQIQARAFQIYTEKGNQGSAVENWLQAEKELTK